MTAHDDDRHAHHHHDVDALHIAIVTISTSRTLADDPAGDAAAALASEAGHTVVARELVADDAPAIQRVVRTLLSGEDAGLIVTMGGTGATPDDVTPAAVSALFDITLPGFGERFRAKSVEQIGPLAIASRATAGVASGVPVFCVPGSEPAVRMAMTEFILPVGGHIAGLATREA